MLKRMLTDNAGKGASDVQRRSGTAESPGTAYAAHNQAAENVWFASEALSDTIKLIKAGPKF